MNALGRTLVFVGVFYFEDVLSFLGEHAVDTFLCSVYEGFAYFFVAFKKHSTRAIELLLPYELARLCCLTKVLLPLPAVVLLKIRGVLAEGVYEGVAP